MKKVRIIYLSIMLLFIFSCNVYGVEVNTFKELSDLINSEAVDLEITLGTSFEFDNKISIVNKNVVIDGNGNTLTRNKEYKLGLFEIDESSKLNLNNIVIDGNSSDWKLDMENQAYFGNYVRVPVVISENNVQATESLIVNKGELNLLKTEIKNNLSTIKKGNIIYNYSDLNIKESVFSKNHINNSGASGVVVYSDVDSNLRVEKSTFLENILGNTAASSAGSCFYINKADSFYVGNDCYFENNFAQGNASCAYVVGTEFVVENSKFINNGVGNDSGVMCIDATEALRNKKIVIQNCLFDKSYGLSLKSQSMASVIGTCGTVSERLDIDILNSEFSNNVASVGVISNHGGNSDYIYFNVDNCHFHDNKNTVFNSQYGNYTVTNCIIENNGVTESSARPTVAWLYGQSEFIIKNSIIRNNVTENEGGATIRVRGVEEDDPTTLTIGEGTEIYGNKAEQGGAIFVEFYTDTALAKVVIKEGVSIYDNTAKVAGDDIYIKCPDKDYSNLELVLPNVEGMELSGYNNWFYDYNDSRFDDSDEVTIYNDVKDRDGLALKVAGVNKVIYETFTPDGLKQTEEIYLKTNQEKNITLEEPKKEGYEFIGWNTKEDGTGDLIEPGELYDGAGGYILYAQYKEIKKEENIIENTIVVENIVMENVSNKNVQDTLSNNQKVKVSDTNNNDYNVLMIIGICFVIIGTGVIIYGKSYKKEKK